MFYKYGTIYRDYLFDYKRIDYCELMKKKRIVRYSNPLADIARLTITKCLPQMDHECPFLPQFYNNSAIDINGTLPSLLPPVVPAGECHATQNHIRIWYFVFKGQFKFYGRVYLQNNKTIAELEGQVVIKPNLENRAGDFSMLGMG